MRGVSDLRVFLLFPLISHFNTLSILNFVSKKIPNSLNLSRAEKQPETRTRSRQTSTVQQARLVHPVDNPEHILQKKARVVAKRRRVSSEMSELSEWPTPSLGSLLDVEPNPFLDTSAERTGPIYPGRFSLSSVCVIPEESLEELISEVTQALSDNLTSLPPSRTSTPSFINPTTTLQTKSDMTAKLNMPMPLSLSAPKWDGQSRTLRNFLRIMEQLF